MNSPDLLDQKDDPRAAAILAAAYEVFLRYGYRRTSMEDIARGAGISRPALYLHFRNKEAIFRSLVAAHYAKASADVAKALRGPGSVTDRLDRAFAAQCGAAKEAILTSPHGRELLDTGLAVGAEIARAGEADLAALYADWLQGEAAEGRIAASALGGDAAELSRTLLAALHGLSDPLPEFPTYQVRVTRLATLFGRALSVEDA